MSAPRCALSFFEPYRLDEQLVRPQPIYARAPAPVSAQEFGLACPVFAGDAIATLLGRCCKRRQAQDRTRHSDRACFSGSRRSDSEGSQSGSGRVQRAASRQRSAGHGPVHHCVVRRSWNLRTSSRAMRDRDRCCWFFSRLVCPRPHETRPTLLAYAATPRFPDSGSASPRVCDAGRASGSWRFPGHGMAHAPHQPWRMRTPVFCGDPCACVRPDGRRSLPRRPPSYQLGGGTRY